MKQVMTRPQKTRADAVRLAGSVEHERIGYGSSQIPELVRRTIEKLLQLSAVYVDPHLRNALKVVPEDLEVATAGILREHRSRLHESLVYAAPVLPFRMVVRCQWTLRVNRQAMVDCSGQSRRHNACDRVDC